MYFLHQIALLGPILAAAAIIPPRAADASAITTPFRLSAVDLSTGAATPLTIGASFASRHILRRVSTSTSTSTTTPASSGSSDGASRFTYDAAVRRLLSAEFGSSDPVIANRTLTFGEFDVPADGRLAITGRKDGGNNSASRDDATYFVYAAADDDDNSDNDVHVDGVDGWALCGSNGIYWSGAQEPLENCVKVALTIR